MEQRTYFNKLRSLTKQKIQVEHHVSNIKSYIYNNKIPNGLNIKLTPQTPGVKSFRFLKRWDETLFNCSFRLLQLLLSFSIYSYKQINSGINEMISTPPMSITNGDMDLIKKRLSDIERIESQNYKTKQQNKFARDGLKQFSNFDTNNILKESKLKQPRKRRFKKRTRPAENNLVVNLSSTELTNSEEKLLSRGLNFCPIPANINNLQLETDVDQFARRLRLKEHFNRQHKKTLQEAGMNDSEYESDKEDKCIPRFKKKSEWNPPRSKNDNLESFISSIKTEVKSSVSAKRLRNLSERKPSH